MRVWSETGLSFDDVLLCPQYSDIASRDDVDISTQLGRMRLKLPIVSANMDTVTEANMAIAMAKAGGAGILHRFGSYDNHCFWLQSMRSVGAHPRIVSIGVDPNYEDLAILVNEYAIDAVCIDVAHGDHFKVIEVIKFLRNNFRSNLDIIAGNVATASGARRLVDAGANIIKVGIGPGAVCTTRVVSGHGIPQLTAISNVAKAFAREEVSVIGDGGIRYPGDIVKALAAGADAVMLGSLLAGTEEAPGEIIIEHGQSYKTFRGSASYAAQKDRSGRAPRVEGVSAKVPYRGSVYATLQNLERGIRSGFSYSGAVNIAELYERAEFVRVTPNGLREGQPHVYQPYAL